MKKTEKHFVICVQNKGYLASLEKRKLYPVLEDEEAEKLGLLRIIDESGEDYLYPEDFFVSLVLPRSIEKKLALAS